MDIAEFVEKVDVIMNETRNDKRGQDLVHYGRWVLQKEARRAG